MSRATLHAVGPQDHPNGPSSVKRQPRDGVSQDAQSMDPLAAHALSLRARNLSLSSRKSSSTALTSLTAHAQADLLTLTHADIEAWAADRLSHVGARTVRANLTWIKCFYRWAVDNEYLTHDPSARIRSPRTPRTLPRPISEQRLARAVAAADDRTRAILLLAALAGLRGAEIAGLSWAHVQLEEAEPVLRVMGKGSRERVVDISPELAEALLALPHRRGPVIRRADGSIAHNRPARISQLGNDHLHACGAPDTLHSLRHRFATQVCRVAGIREAQEALGHASAATTSIYTAVSRRDARAAVLAVGRIVA